MISESGLNQVIEDENRYRIKHRLFMFCVGKTLGGGKPSIVFSTYSLLNLEYFGNNDMGAPGCEKNCKKLQKIDPTVVETKLVKDHLGDSIQRHGHYAKFL